MSLILGYQKTVKVVSTVEVGFERCTRFVELIIRDSRQRISVRLVHDLFQNLLTEF